MKQRKVLNYDQVNHIVRRYRIRIGKFKILQNGLLEIDGGFKMCDTTLTKLPLSFASVTGDFVVRSNRLTTLKGCPAVVGGDFDCRNNNLSLLKHGPRTVGRNYNCQDNDLISLEGAAENVPNTFNCAINDLTSLDYGPKVVGGNYLATQNQITSLLGSPRLVGGAFTVPANPLINLVGCPENIGTVFSFDHTVPSLYMGSNNCIVPRVQMEKLKNYNKDIQRSIPRSILNWHLPIIFKYSHLLEIWNAENDTINEGHLDDMLFEINDGML